MPITVEKPKWILYKHTNSYDMIRRVASLMKGMAANIDEEHRRAFWHKMEAAGIYNPRNTQDKPLDSVNHRINTLEYFLFGYEEDQEKSKRFIFSPLGNLYMQHFSDCDKCRKIFASMLMGVQFPTPANSTPNCFRLFPFRLLFMLMLDPRLDYKIYDSDYVYLIAFESECTESSYEDLVNRIFKWRELSANEQYLLLKEDEHTYVVADYEWSYYMSKILDEAGICERHKGELIGYLYHPTKTGSKSKPTKRSLTDSYTCISPYVQDFIKKMLAAYSPYERPLSLWDDPNRLEFDIKKEIYSYYPRVLLEEIGEYDETIQNLLALPKLIKEYSKNIGNRTEYLFEDVLTKGFNAFYNVEVEKVGGSGNSDIVCVYTGETCITKFDVEAKSTMHKLTSINSGRLEKHRNDINGEYTILICPAYTPACKSDIKGRKIVIVLASTFAEYLYNHILSGCREIDYKDFDEIIKPNLGKDISKLISDVTISKFSSPAA